MVHLEVVRSVRLDIVDRQVQIAVKRTRGGNRPEEMIRGVVNRQGGNEQTQAGCFQLDIERSRQRVGRGRQLVVVGIAGRAEVRLECKLRRIVPNRSRGGKGVID